MGGLITAIPGLCNHAVQTPETPRGLDGSVAKVHLLRAIGAHATLSKPGQGVSWRLKGFKLPPIQLKYQRCNVIGHSLVLLLV